MLKKSNKALTLKYKQTMKNTWLQVPSYISLGGYPTQQLGCGTER